MTSLVWTWGSWQLVHSTFPLINFTLCDGSAVTPEDTKEAWRLAVSLIGVTRLKGCELVRSRPKVSPGVQLPTVVTFPYAAVCPTATVPSWQLRQRLLGTPNGGGGVAGWW